MKPTDNAILGMVSESPGRNASEPVVASTKNELRRPSPLLSGEGSRAWRRLTDAPHHFGGVVRGSTVTICPARPVVESPMAGTAGFCGAGAFWAESSPGPIRAAAR